MNFLIDGAYGDLYRAAMLYPQQSGSADEWDAERRLAETDADKRRAWRRMSRATLAWFAARYTWALKEFKAGMRSGVGPLKPIDGKPSGAPRPRS